MMRILLIALANLFVVSAVAIAETSDQKKGQDHYEAFAAEYVYPPNPPAREPIDPALLQRMKPSEVSVVIFVEKSLAAERKKIVEDREHIAFYKSMAGLDEYDKNNFPAHKNENCKRYYNSAVEAENDFVNEGDVSDRGTAWVYMLLEVRSCGVQLEQAKKAVQAMDKRREAKLFKSLLMEGELIRKKEIQSERGKEETRELLGEQNELMRKQNELLESNGAGGLGNQGSNNTTCVYLGNGVTHCF